MRTDLRIRRDRHDEDGFSASEMLVVVAIIGIMVLVTTPQLLNFWNSMKVRTAAHRMMSSLRLCRQAAVSKRTDVLMQVQRTQGATQPTYKAWEERSSPRNLVRNPNGADNTVSNLDDERWVVRPDTTMGVEKVTWVDSYDDVTPDNALDAPGTSVMKARTM